MIVLDARRPLMTPAGAAVARRLRGETVHAPAHFDVEVIGAIRQAVVRQLISDSRRTSSWLSTSLACPFAGR